MAGFLAVFSSVLSAYSLVVITVERLYAVSHAVDVKQRMSHAFAGLSYSHSLGARARVLSFFPVVASMFI